MKNIYFLATALLFCVCLLRLFGSCATSEESLRIAGFDNKGKTNAQDIKFGSFKCFQLQSNGNQPLQTVKKVIKVDSLLLISDGNVLSAFNVTGRFLRNYGVHGHAANEYINLSTFYLDKTGNIAIIDNFASKIILFKRDGKWLKTINAKEGVFRYVQNATQLDAVHLLVSRYIYNDQNVLYQIINLNNWETSDNVSTPLRTDNTMEYAGVHSYSVNRGAVHAVLPFSATIVGMNDANSFTIATSQNVLSEQELSKIKNFSIMSYQNAILRDNFVGFTDIFETNNMYLLAFSNLYYCIIPKNTMHCERYNYEVPEKVHRLPLIGIIAGDDRQLIGVMTPDQLKNIEIKGNDKKLQSLKRLQTKLDLNGNPIVLMYELQ